MSARLSRSALTLAVIAAVVATPLSAPEALAAEAGPREVTTVPFDEPSADLSHKLLVAGDTGFLHQQEGRVGYVWTEYASGETVAVPLPRTNLSFVRFVPAGADRIAYQVNGDDSFFVLAGPTATPVRYQLRDWRVLQGLSADGTRALLLGSQPGVVLLGAGGAFSRIPITGLPASANFGPGGVETGPNGLAVLRYTAVVEGAAERVTQYALLDVATGRAAVIPGVDPATFGVRTSGRFVYAINGSTLSLLPTADVLAGTATAESWRGVRTPEQFERATIIGDNAILKLYGGPARVVSVPLTAAAELPPAVEWQMLVAELVGQETAYVTGVSGVIAIGGPEGERAVLRLAARDNGSVGVARLIGLTRPPTEARPAGVTLAYGMVRVVTHRADPGTAARLWVNNHPLAATSTSDWQLGVASWRQFGMWDDALTCPQQPNCIRAVDGTTSGAVYLRRGTDPDSTLVQTMRDRNSSSHAIALPTTGATLADVDTRFVVVDGAQPASQYLVDLSSDKIVRTSPVAAAALWYGTYWRATGGDTIEATDAETGAARRTVHTGASCTPTELQVAQRWLYWRCGETGPAGVLDLTGSAKVTVDGGPALLGDGFVVRHDRSSGRLLSTDITSGAAADPVNVGSVLPGPADDRNVTWAVDRHSGWIAYAAADGRVHVVDPGVTESAPTATADAAERTSPRGQWPGWVLYATVSRPIASWQLAIAERATGRTAVTLTGGPTPAQLFARWDAKLPGGALPPNGTYTWQLTVTPAGDGERSVAVGSGSVFLECGKAQFRTFDCYGDAALLAVRPDSRGHWHISNTQGKLWDQGWTENWRMGAGAHNLVLPFGDVNGDGNADVLGRGTSGNLWATLGIGQAHFGGRTAVRIGGGWNIYPTLLAPGDLNQDGRDDLLGRDAKGRLWFYPGNGKSGFGARVLLGAGWSMYGRLVAVGDLTGDGKPDLLGIDAKGGVFRYSGNGKGGVSGPQVRIDVGFAGYNAVVGVGDVNKDGRNDLVARDKSGVLWQYNGNAQGAFAPRVRVGSGWNAFSYLF